MFTPRHFAQDDITRVHDLIRSYSLAVVVTSIEGRFEATHVPVVLDAERGEHGTLRFHLARANPSATALESGEEVLVVFVGPHTYISPDWYANEHLVPTWNYAVAHVYGIPRTLDDHGLRRLLDDLSTSQESQLPKTPWTVDKLPGELVDKMCRAIVGFELPIAHLQGKWKMGQNRGAADRAGAASALEALGGEMRLAVAATMKGQD